jgi:hypothetical protein
MEPLTRWFTDSLCLERRFCAATELITDDEKNRAAHNFDGCNLLATNVNVELAMTTVLAQGRSLS